MEKFKPILLVLSVLILLGLVCSAGASNLLDNTSHVITAQSNLEAIKTIRFQASTINSLANGYLIALVVMAVVLLGGLVFAWKMIGRVSTSPPSRDNTRWLDPGGAPRFLPLGDDTRARLRRLNPTQQRQLLERLYVVCSWLEQDLGHGQQLPIVYEKRNADVDTITWG